MAIIITSKGIEILVDDKDFEKFNQNKWNISSKGYARRNIWLPELKKFQVLYMHRFIMGLSSGDKQIVDHKNRNKLDNRRENLRIVSASQNSWNYSKRIDNSSGFIGVTLTKRNNKNPWGASIALKGKSIHLGYFATPEEAHEAYLVARAKYHPFD